MFQTYLRQRCNLEICQGPVVADNPRKNVHGGFHLAAVLHMRIGVGCHQAIHRYSDTV